MAKKNGGWPTNKIVSALKRRYTDPEWALFTEVRNQTGFGHDVKAADALAMSLYPSRGIALHGFEVKASRSDWLKELRDPEKAAVIQAYCDRWWVVAGSSDIVEESELPKNWGLLVPSGTGLKVKKSAPKLKPKKLSMSFIASILRSATRVGKEDLHEEFSRGVKDGIARSKVSSDATIEELRRAIAKFEDASGVEIGQSWNATRIGEAVKAVMAGEHLVLAGRLKQIRSMAKRVMEATKEIE